MKTHDTQDSLSRYNVEELARASGWTTRKSGKLTALEFCSTMIEATKTPNASLRIVAFLSHAVSSVSVSKQALHKRINDRACKLFESLLGKVVSEKAGPADRKLGFKRIIVQDSTSIALPTHLFEAFKGAGNASGEYAGLKVHASFDLLARRFTGFAICEHRRADQGFSLEGAKGLEEGDLLVRDLGYFNIAAFRRIKKSKVDVLTRWQPHTTLLDPEGQDEIGLLELLRGSSRIDRDVLVGRRERFPMRLIAFRVPAQVAEKRRRKLREMARRRGKTASRELLDLQDWQIHLATCGSESLSVENAFELYRQRWTIEILFKGFKSHMRVDGIPPLASSRMVRCLVLCALIRIALGTVVILPILEGSPDREDVSLLKLYSLVEALGFDPDSSYFADPSNLDNFLRHCRYEKRKRKSMPRKLNSLG